MEENKPAVTLPDNAYRELNPDEEYHPVVPADAPACSRIAAGMFLP